MACKCPINLNFPLSLPPTLLPFLLNIFPPCQIKAAIMVVLGGADLMTPCFQGKLLYNTLKAQGKDTK